MYNQRLPFLPGSTSALMAVFPAGRTFGFKLFPIVIFSYFLLVILFIFLIFVIICYFPLNEDLVVIFCVFNYFFLFLTSFEVHLVSVALLDDCPGLMTLFVVRSGSVIPHLQALRLLVVILVSPVPVSIVFRVFNFNFFSSCLF